MVAALRNLQIAVVTRGELEVGVFDCAARYEIEIGRSGRRRRLVHRRDDLFVLVRAGDREHGGEAGADDLGLLAHAAGDDDAAVLGDRLADRLQAFLLGAVEEAAGVDQHDVGAAIVGRHLVAVGPQPRQDTLAVDQVLGTAERDHADARRGGENGGHRCRAT